MGLSIKGKLWAQAGVVSAALAGAGCVAGMSAGVPEGAVQWIFGVLAVSGVVTVVGTKVLISQVCDALGRAADSARRVAEGDLTEDIRSDRGDEIGRLLEALGDSQGSMRRSVAQVRQTAESIQLAASEVAAGNQDLSGRTEQTASSLQQTSSSMEQLTGTVRQTADSARTANQLASSAAQAAQRGGEVVSQVVANMEEISTSSRKIADIIGVIDGIAFQTNILALNAAVEAARAGEQGRGFAVVATEVRNLAQRSANAAREIKTLIGASVEKVESGSRLVQDAGSTMTEIVSGVQRVTDIIGEITAAATEQSNELVQVNTAVTQLDQMTQQNAALVEQSAAAAESLKEQAVRMAGAVESFKLGQGPVAAAPRAAAPVAAPAKAKASAPASQQGAHKPGPAASKAAAPVKAASTTSMAAAAKPAPVKPAAAAARHEPEAETEWTSF